MFVMPESRYTAFAIHLAMSFLIFLFLISLIYFVWFPGMFINYGGWQGMKIVAGVDLVLGPFLTLVIYNKYKKKVKMDLCIIALVQFVSLSAGVWLVYQQRPMLQVVKIDFATLLTYQEVKKYKIDRNAFSNIPGPYPKLVWLDLPEDKKAGSSMDFTFYLADGIPVAAATHLYKQFKDFPESHQKWRLEQLEQKGGCYRIEVDSVQNIGSSCLDPETGLYGFFPSKSGQSQDITHQAINNNTSLPGR